MVRATGHLRFHLPRLGEEPRGAAGPVRRAPGDRDLQHLVGAHALQHALPHARRARPQRRARGGRFPHGIPGDVARRDAASATAMLYRNLASMDVEESIRANPLDGVVLLMGCDKTTPSLLMGAASVDIPAIGVSGGPMLSGKYRGSDIGSGTNTWSMSEDLRAGKI